MKSFLAMAAVVTLVTCWSPTRAVAKAPVSKIAENRVVIYMTLGSAEIDGVEITLARRQASRLLASAGVTLEWRYGQPRSDSRGARVIGIAFAVEAPAAFCDRQHAEALAAARPYGENVTSILVFADRIAMLGSNFHQPQTGKLLGHVLAHEIGHVLEGVSRHSKTGLMKPRWDGADYRTMFRSGLAFAPEDVYLITAAIESSSAIAVAGKSAGQPE